MTTTMTTTILTPIEIRIPGLATGVLEDLGLELVHDITGDRRNYLHRVVVRQGSEAERYLLDGGYSAQSGHRRGTIQYWTYTKEFPLSVENW